MHLRHFIVSFTKVMNEHHVSAPFYSKLYWKRCLYLSSLFHFSFSLEHWTIRLLSPTVPCNTAWKNTLDKVSNELVAKSSCHFSVVILLDLSATWSSLLHQPHTPALSTSFIGIQLHVLHCYSSDTLSRIQYHLCCCLLFCLRPSYSQTGTYILISSMN